MLRVHHFHNRITLDKQTMVGLARKQPTAIVFSSRCLQFQPNKVTHFPWNFSNFSSVLVSAVNCNCTFLCSNVTVLCPYLPSRMPCNIRLVRQALLWPALSRCPRRLPHPALANTLFIALGARATGLNLAPRTAGRRSYISFKKKHV